MFHLALFSMMILLAACGGKSDPDPEPGTAVKWEISPASLAFTGKGETKSIMISANGDWRVSSSQSWCTVASSTGYNGQTSLKVTVEPNRMEEPRTAELTFKAVSGDSSETYTVTQDAGEEENYVPADYSMVWQEEFDAPRESGGRPAMPATEKWWFETGDHGWGNNEIQNYIDRFVGTDTCAVVTDGTLKIIAKKKGSEVISIRMNSNDSWTYGYFEARLKVPGGKGTWPAFWMLPEDFQDWPLDGEIDIMEYVGFDPDVVHSTVHTQAYNHSIGTQMGASRTIRNAETEFHIYAVEWTANYIKGFVDGEAYFTFTNDGKGDVNTWPFDKPFYLKLNLAWGGNWGGQDGVDESVLPATFEIDYVRVYQKE